jgi:hypothetical protein
VIGIGLSSRFLDATAFYALGAGANALLLSFNHGPNALEVGVESSFGSAGLFDANAAFGFGTSPTFHAVPGLRSFAAKIAFF